MTTTSEVAASAPVVGSDAAKTHVFHAPKVEVVSGRGALADAPLPGKSTDVPSDSSRALIDSMFADDDEEAPAEKPSAAAKAGEPAAEVKPAEKAVEAAPDVAAAKAEAEQLRRELAVERARARQQPPADDGPSEDDQRAYLTDPVAFLRGTIARQLGTKPDDKLVDKELAHYRRRLTADLIGDGLDEASRKELRLDEIDRNDRLDQQVKASARERAKKGTDGQPDVVRFVSSVIESAKPDEFPHLHLAAEFGEDPAQVGLSLLLAERDAGRLKPGLTDTEYAREAARLGNDYFHNRAKRVSSKIDKTRPDDTSPTAATASAQAGGAAPTTEGRKTEPTQAPANQAATASPATLRARSAAEAPAAATLEPEKPKKSINPHLKTNTKAAIDDILGEMGLKG